MSWWPARTDTCTGLVTAFAFGHNPRLPCDLTSDDAVDRIGLDDMQEHDVEADSVATNFARAQEVRHRTRELIFQRSASEKLRVAARSATPQPIHAHRGQRV